MLETELKPFSEILRSICQLVTRGAYVPSGMDTALWFNALRGYDFVDVKGALDAHLRDPERGRFVPLPADIVAHLQRVAAADNRPGPEEAWSTALAGADESRTIVWTAEMAEAWGICRPVLDVGDEVGARMAFREAYTRLVGEARAERRPPQWLVSLGFDQQQREAAIAEAKARGHLALEAPNAPLLTGPAAARGLEALATSRSVPPAARDALMRLRSGLIERINAEPPASADAVAKQETTAWKADTARAVAEYRADADAITPTEDESQ